MPGLLIRAFLKNPAKGWDSIRTKYGVISAIRPFFALFQSAVFLVTGNYLGLNGGEQENMPIECQYVAAKGTIISPD
jgi:hypothetical protein